MNKYNVDEKCINCKACVRVAPDIYKIDNGKAIVFHQPETQEEEKLAQKALNVCPVKAISIVKDEKKPILATDKVKDTIKKYPILNFKLLKLSPKFKRLSNPIMWNTFAKYATFNDAAKMTGLSVCEILHFVNKELGLEDKLQNSFPNCIDLKLPSSVDYGVDIFWPKSDSSFQLNFDEENDFEKAIDLLKSLNSNESINFIVEDINVPLIDIIKEYKYLYNIKQINIKKYVISIYNNNTIDRSVKDEYEKMDVREMDEDPFDIILKKAYQLNPGEGFILIQTFVPHPLISMLSELGFEYEIDTKKAMEVWVYFTKTKDQTQLNETQNGDRPSITIQSATPVGYPIIMRLLQSKRMNKVVKIVDLKIWEETEKHLGWIVNKKADISFSALITASKLTDFDVKMPVVFVWDNFSILSRLKKIQSMHDLVGKTIHVPLFEDAPPAKITKYLIESVNEDIKDFTFEYGKPFGRPAEMYREFVEGNIETVLLREPEASFAINNLKKKNIEYSEISYGKIWNDVNKGFGLFPNAGVVIKGELVRKYPDIVKIFAEELKEAIEWVNNHKQAASDLAFDMMRAKSDDVRLFLDRVTYQYVDGDQLVSKVKEFYEILNEKNILQVDVTEELLNMFKIEN